jgi:hypothetical protein
LLELVEEISTLTSASAFLAETFAEKVVHAVRITIKVNAMQRPAAIVGIELVGMPRK